MSSFDIRWNMAQSGCGNGPIRSGRFRDRKMEDRIKELLKELGTAINESVSGSNNVNGMIQQIRDEGYDLYVVLDATIGLSRSDDDEPAQEERTQRLALPAGEAQFRIDVEDLNFLKSVGIDPTRKVKSSKNG